MSNNVSAHATSHPVEGGTEVDVTVTLLAGDVHPLTPVVPVDDPGAVPVSASDLAADVPVHPVIGSHGPADAGADTPPAPTASGHPGDTPTTTAGDAGNALVVRPDDPNATPVPAGDLDPSTVVIPADTTPAEPAPVTAADLAVALYDGDETAGAEALRRLTVAGFRVVRA